MSLTEEQSAAVAARGKTIVSASAGSGKTHVMIERFVSLLEGDIGVREVLAVTFTKKAAAQMRDRARKKLLEALRAARGEAREKLRARLDELPLADICTIDSFCARTVRSYFFLAGVDPRFRVLGEEDAEGAAISARALDGVLDAAYAEHGEWFERLLAVYASKKGDDSLRKNVLDLYGKMRESADYRATLTAIAEADGEKIGEEYARVLAFLTEDAKRRAAKILASAEEALAAAEADAPRAVPCLRELLGMLNTAAGAETLADLSLLAGEKPKGISNRSNKDSAAAAAAIEKMKAAVSAWAEWGKRVKSYCAPAEEAFFGARAVAASFARLALLYDDAYAACKREAGVLDYADLEQLTLGILRNDEARAAIRGKYRAVFVDEYQDVNPLQSTLVDLVAGEDLFLVGDKKQAIYCFRGSRTKYFAEKEREFAPALGLNVNFRSADAVLEAVNLVFTSLDPAYVPVRGSGRYGGNRGEVLLHTVRPRARAPLAERGVYSAMEASGVRKSDPVAEAVLSVVERECGVHGGAYYIDVDDGGKQKKVGYGDIAVLVRKNETVAKAIVRELSDHGIPVSTSAEVNLCELFEARLLLDWASYLDDPEQDIPLATAMLSALGGFSDGELARIRITAGGSGSFRAACRAYLKGEGDLREKLSAFFARAAHYRLLAQVRSAEEMFSLLLADGLEAQIAAKGDAAGRLARVRRLIAESRGCGTLHAFLRKLKQLKNRVSYRENGGEGAVKVLTMHSSKGLEYPVVILADLDTVYSAPAKNALMVTEEFGVAPRYYDLGRRTYGSTAARLASEIVLRQQDFEGERNLLYVAMTRAKYRLHIVTARDFSTPASEEDKRISDLFPASFTRYEAREEEETLPPLPVFALEYRADADTVASIRAASAPYAFEQSTRVPVKSSATELLRAEKDEFFGSGFTAEEGTAYHAFMEHVRFGADAEEELARMKEEGLLTEEQLALVDSARLKAILAMPCLSALAGKRTRREQQFLVSFPASDFPDLFGSADDEILFQGAIDLLAEDGERYTVVDYKYSARDEQGIRDHYGIQLRLYRKAVSQILHVPEARVKMRVVNLALCKEIEM